MATKKVQYNGNTLYANREGKFINFGLYGMDDIDFEASKINIKNAFKLKYKKALTAILDSIGLKYCDMIYFSPKAYNFSNDALDLVIRVVDKKRFKFIIQQHKNKIQKNLDKNKSYDGYMATTVDSVDNELEKLEKSEYQPDIVVLSVIINFYLKFDFDLYEHLIYE